jgi:thymidylate synthase (FAD)
MSIEFVPMSVEPLGMAPASQGDMLEHIERCGRVAYKSEDKITEGSAEKFVKMLAGKGHLSVLEHSNIVLKAASYQAQALAHVFKQFLYHRGIYHPMRQVGTNIFIAGSVRAWMETMDYLNSEELWVGEEYEWLLWDLQCALQTYYSTLFPEGESWPGCPIVPMLEGEQSYYANHYGIDLPVFTFKITCDRGISHEIVRHRSLSFTQNSTRYVSYKNKASFIAGDEAMKRLPFARIAMDYYREVCEEEGPQFARDFLPHFVKTEMYVSGRPSAWRHFVALRDNKAAHPRIQFIAKEIRRFFEYNGAHGY